MNASRDVRDPSETTGAEWRALGFYHELVPDRQAWRLVGSRSGLLTFARMLERYARDVEGSTDSRPLEVGPYSDLKVRLWERPGIDDESIYGPAQDLRRLGALIEQRLEGATAGTSVVIESEYEPTVEYSLILDVRDDAFDPARAIPVPSPNTDVKSEADATLVHFPSLPFQFHDPDAHFTESEGLVRLEHGALVLEYQTKDAILGAIKSEVKEVEIPLDLISSVEWKQGWFSTKISVQARDMKTVGDIPSSKLGRFRLKFKRRYRDQAQQLAEELQAHL